MYCSKVKRQEGFAIALSDTGPMRKRLGARR